MRLKIQSEPPLPARKAWFTFDDRQCITVANLKSALAKDVNLKFKCASLDLTFDDFELLDTSPLLDLLRDGDLVVVKAAETTANISEVGKKRKRSISRSATKPPSLPLPSSTPSSSSSSSSPSPSSSSSSSDDSDSDSDSDSSSSSSTTPPTSASCKRAPVPHSTQTARRSFIYPPASSTPTIPVAPKIMVPPGQGKPSTRARNARRRIKRTASVSLTLPDFVSTTNAIPVAQPEAEANRRAKVRRIHGPAPDVAFALNNAFGGNERAGRLDPGTLASSPSPSSVSSSSSVPTPQYPPTEAEEMLNVQMMSMLPKSKNKNKSRRVGEDIDPRTRKIVFGTPTPPPSAPPISVEEETWQVQRPALIPPSSLPAHLIPANVFITSVDVEEGLKKSKKKKRKVQEEESWGMEEETVVTVLDYGEEQEQREEQDGKDDGLDPAMFDFDAAPLITSHAQLTEGCIIGFMGLTVNLETRCPEFGKRYGRVVTVSWAEERGVKIRSMFLGEYMEEEEDFGWNQIQGTWKLLQ